MRTSWRAFEAREEMSPGALLRVPTLEDAGIVIACTTRLGGTMPDGACDLALRGAPAPERVLIHRARVLEALGLPLDAWTVGEQVHGAAVHAVESGDRGAGARSDGTTIAGADGLVTSEHGVALAVLAADCVPIALADPVSRRVGVIHAGWRGLVAGVVEATVAAFGASADAVAVIGPAIGPCCYEVGEEVRGPAVDRFGATVARGTHVDLWEAAVLALRGSGVTTLLPTGLCTRCEPERFFSHRAGATGRHAIIAAIR